MRMVKLDNGFFVISQKNAKVLMGGRLPRHGYEALVEHEGQHYWLGRTFHDGKVKWAIRNTPWRLVNGQARL